ncbi:MAG: putative ABC transporter permease [Lachnospiraceae bacterium]|nr:putative ABC transporter permease [Lachnospiraceae bacterium]
MWSKEIFGTDIYHLLATFILYSMLGWLIESIYMSYCNKKLTNRGFGRGPFCPIYGFGGVIGYLVMQPLRTHVVLLYLVGAILATSFEFVVALLMQKLFGMVWWDYNDKPLNYKGIICLESTIAWGFYACIIVLFLNHRLVGLIDRYDAQFGELACTVIMVLETIDYLIQLSKVIDLGTGKEKLLEKYCQIRGRFNQ